MSHTGTLLFLGSDDPLRKDMYVRFGQSLQEFMNASAAARASSACPGKVDAIYEVEGDFLGRFAIVLQECIDCGLCVPLCPVGCIHDAREQGIVEGSGGYMKIKELRR